MNFSKLIELMLSSSLALSSSTALLPAFSLTLQASGTETGTSQSPITNNAGLLSVLTAGDLAGSATEVNNVVQLQKDVTINQSLYINGANQGLITLDLHGHTLAITPTTDANAGIILNNTYNYSFNIEDSGSNGTIVNNAANAETASTTDNAFALIQAGSSEGSGQVSLILDSGTLHSDQITLSLDSGSQTTINGATIESTNQSLQTINLAGQASLIMNDGTIDSDAVVIKQDVIESHNCAIKLNGSSSFTLKKGTISAPQAHGIYLYDTSTLLVQGGEVSGVCAIRTNGNLTDASARITIAAGTIKGNESNAGIYIPSAQVNVTGGNISGGIGIFVRGQNNGTLSGSEYGGGLSISGGTITGLAKTGADPGTASIAAGYGNGAVLYDYNNTAEPPYDAGTGLVNISGGSFSSPAGTQAVKVLNVGQSLWNQASSPLTITGGSFSSMVQAGYLNAGLCQLQSKAGGPYSYMSTASGQSQFNATPGSLYTSYENLQKAQQASSGLYYTLNLQGGTETVTYTSVPAGSLINLPPVSKSGYTFTGYAPAGGALVSNPYTINSNATLIAQFSVQQPEPINPPASGAGIDQPGSQTVPNTGDQTSTTYTRDYGGVTSKIVTDNANGAIKSLIASIPAISAGNSAQNPISIPLGQNTLTSQAITLAGNAALSNGAVITIELPAGLSSAWISLPITNALYSTVAMMQSGAEANGWKPIAQSNIEVDKSVLVLPVSNGQSFLVCSNAKVFADQAALPGYGVDGVSYLSSRDLMGVDMNGNRFNPYATINRAQLALILYRFAGSPSASSYSLPEDVPNDVYFSNAARWAAGTGLMAQGSLFSGERELSREEMATILYRYQKASASNLSVLDHYEDQNAISSWAREGMAWSVENGLMGVNSGLDPLRQASRVNAATILFRYFESVFPARS